MDIEKAQKEYDYMSISVPMYMERARETLSLATDRLYEELKTIEDICPASKPWFGYIYELMTVLECAADEYHKAEGEITAGFEAMSKAFYEDEDATE